MRLALNRMDLNAQRERERDACKTHFDAMMRMLPAQAVDEANAYMDRVLQTEGRRVHDTVLSMVSAACAIPPVDIPR